MIIRKVLRIIKYTLLINKLYLNKLGDIIFIFTYSFLKDVRSGISPHEMEVFFSLLQPEKRERESEKSTLLTRSHSNFENVSNVLDSVKVPWLNQLDWQFGVLISLTVG